VTYEEARAMAHREWGGVYSVSRYRDTPDGQPDVWQVLLHAPNGPLHFIRADGPCCRCCADRTD
jgi:hypothetical protein